MTKSENLAIQRIASFFSKYSIFVILAGVFILSSLLNPNFLSPMNLTNILRQNSVVAILALGQTMLIITGMIDLSSGAVMAVAGVMSIFVFRATESLFIAFAVGLSVGVLFNAISGILVSVYKTPPFIATLAVTMIARGSILFFTGGQNLLQLGPFVVFGQGTLFYIPIPILFMFLIVFVTWYILNNTKFGRSLYAIGGNEEAANASGIKIARTKFTCYLVNGLFVGLAGIIFMSRVNAGLPNAGIGLEFDALTAAVIGGTSFSGGIGTAMGTLAGAFIVGILNNIMNLVGVNSHLQQVIRGSIIALAVIMDISAKNKKGRPKRNFLLSK
ncbi:MAG: ABC transporter permease [Spirochaetes bacterium]|nr:ABC transporter permease [Spirochaetota bacterium]